MKAHRNGPSLTRYVCGLGAVAACFAWPSVAEAQTATFKLDRLEVPGAPDDTMMMARAVTQPGPIFFAQLGMGYSVNPLKTANIYAAKNNRFLTTIPDRGVVQGQFSIYTALGVQLFNRVTVTAAFPFTPYQYTKNPDYPNSTSSTNNQTTPVSTSDQTWGDVRIDMRAVLWRSTDQRFALGAGLSIFAPIGDNAAFGADRNIGAILGVQAEYAFKFPLVLMGTTGIAFRTTAVINDPPHASGLAVADEWRWQVGGFVPIKDGKYRIGLTIQGQTGIESDSSSASPLIGNTAFTQRNTPIEWHVEGRAKFGPKERWWVGLGAGSFLYPGYGAPDFRAVGLLGVYVPILDSSANSPEGKLALREKWREQRSLDSDNDGIPDDIDACPSDAEDHKGSDPSDGCPIPPDRDGDGIADQFDKCPDQPEDKDGVDDNDGCPEVDADNDGVPDAEDACPKEPGVRSTDPKKNGCPQFYSMDGTVVHVLQQVHFATGSATILADSFPMLQEIANLLKVNPAIKKMSVEGHTDNRGNAVMNKTLSQQRSESVVKWLADHGVEGPRLEAHGYGQEKPIDSNDTDKGRQANRRVEFKIIEQDDGKPKPNKPNP